MELEKTEFELSAKERYISVFDSSELRVLSFENVENPVEDVEVMFIPGLLTIFPRWEKVVKELNEHYKVHYIESREKKTSKLVRKASLKIVEMSKDLDNIEKDLGLDNKKYITVSSSMGGSMILENLAAKRISPIGSILVSPGVEVPFPRYVLLLLRILPVFVINWIKPIIKRFVRKRAADAEKEPIQAAAYVRSVEEADVRKMKKCILKNARKYNGWDLLPKIKDRIILIGATTDKSHSSDFSANVAKSLSNSTYIDLGTNRAAHDTPLVELSVKFVQELVEKGPKITKDTTINLDGIKRKE
ncbi:MAG: hypothetical protein FK733_04015 [Asgard group archaeon]|nr:hypothetical protein [Asgard group archaeon]